MSEGTQTPQSTTTNAYSAFIPEIWSQKLNYMLEKECGEFVYLKQQIQQQNEE